MLVERRRTVGNPVDPCVPCGHDANVASERSTPVAITYQLIEAGSRSAACFAAITADVYPRVSMDAKLRYLQRLREALEEGERRTARQDPCCTRYRRTHRLEETRPVGNLSHQVDCQSARPVPIPAETDRSASHACP
jgi:hypothetical protein